MDCRDRAGRRVEGGEGQDIAHFVTEADGTVRSGLALSNNEKAMLQKVKGYKENGAIKKIIVVHNSPYAMELGWFDEYGVDAALHVGTLGLKGSLGLVDFNGRESFGQTRRYVCNKLPLFCGGANLVRSGVYQLR